jgi:hypothetical protein
MRKSPRTWTPAEDARLREAVSLIGVKRNSWRAIAEYVATDKDDACCYQRWFRVLRPGITRRGWTALEYMHVALGVAFYGTRQWARVAALLPGRTDAHVRTKWLDLVKHAEATQLAGQVESDHEDDHGAMMPLLEAMKAYDAGIERRRPAAHVCRFLAECARETACVCLAKLGEVGFVPLSAAAVNFVASLQCPERKRRLEEERHVDEQHQQHEEEHPEGLGESEEEEEEEEDGGEFLRNLHMDMDLGVPSFDACNSYSSTALTFTPVQHSRSSSAHLMSLDDLLSEAGNHASGTMEFSRMSSLPIVDDLVVFPAW